MLATFLPAFLLSGFMFAIEVMPRALRAVTYLIPARYFLVVTRGIFLKGVGIPVLQVHGLLMVAYAPVGLAAAMASSRRSCDELPPSSPASAPSLSTRIARWRRRIPEIVRKELLQIRRDPGCAG